MSINKLILLFSLILIIKSKEETSLHLKATRDYKSIIESYGYKFEGISSKNRR